ncbi:MAG: hypothetical protein ACTSYU_04740, partial [Promethearchaeota archaeon]
ANARAVADAPTSEAWPAMSGELNISSEFGRHTYNFTQNPANGTQETYLVYDETSGLLLNFDSNFEGYFIKSSLNLQFSSLWVQKYETILENDSLDDENDSPDDENDSPDDEKYSIPGLSLPVILLIFLGTSASLSIVIRKKKKFHF